MWNKSPSYLGKPWLKSVLIPFWILQLIDILGLLILYFYACVYWYGADEAIRYKLLAYATHATIFYNHKLTTASNTIMYIITAFVVLGILIAQIILFAKQSLSPVVMLAMQSYLLLYTTICLLTQGLAYGDILRNGTGDFFTLILTACGLLFYTGTMFYSAVVYKRYRQGELSGQTFELDQRPLRPTSQGFDKVVE